MMFYDKLTPKHIEAAKGYIKEIEIEGEGRKQALRSLRTLYYKYVDKQDNKGKIIDMGCKECSQVIVEEWKRQIARNKNSKKNTYAK
tara:strand:- start:11 stop:271 length:261 start_codon:yes stop_codon:yes gene_type:complete